MSTPNKPNKVEGSEKHENCVECGGHYCDTCIKKHKEAKKYAYEQGVRDERDCLEELLKNHVLWEGDEPKFKQGILAFIADLEGRTDSLKAIE